MRERKRASPTDAARQMGIVVGTVYQTEFPQGTLTGEPKFRVFWSGDWFQFTAQRECPDTPGKVET